MQRTCLGSSSSVKIRLSCSLSKNSPCWWNWGTSSITDRVRSCNVRSAARAAWLQWEALPRLGCSIPAPHSNPLFQSHQGETCTWTWLLGTPRAGKHPPSPGREDRVEPARGDSEKIRNRTGQQDPQIRRRKWVKP